MDGRLRLEGEKKGKVRFGAMVAVKPKRECGLGPSLLSTLRKDKKEMPRSINKIFRQIKPYFSFFPYLGYSGDADPPSPVILTPLQG